MPRECPPAFRSARAVAGTGSAKQRSVRPPSAIAPVRCHVRYCASKKRDDASFTQTLPDRLRAITTVAQYAIRTMAWMCPLSLQAWAGINQCAGLDSRRHFHSIWHTENHSVGVPKVTVICGLRDSKSMLKGRDPADVDGLSLLEARCT